MVLMVAIALIVASAGCLEVKEKPPVGSFTIMVDSEGILYVPASGGRLVGPEAEVETDLHEEEPHYSWAIEGVGEYEGAEVDLPSTDVGLRPATYNVEYFEQERHVPLFVATLPTLSGIYIAVANGTQLEENASTKAELHLEPGKGLLELQADDAGSVLEFAGRLSEGIAFNITLPDTATNATSYVLGIRVHSAPVEEDLGGSIAIHPGQVHRLLYREGELNLTIHPAGDPSNITFEGSYTDLPDEYLPGVGHLTWAGEVGEHESPGMVTWMAVLALAVAMVGSARGRQGRR